MDQLEHIKENKNILERRAEIIRSIREFFWSDNFIEINAPTIIKLPGQEPYLDPMVTSVKNEKGDEQNMYLHTSPEYTMKKSLAAGFENIFSLGPCYRNNESFGGHHNPEFTMIEWYRNDASMEDIMEDCENLLAYLLEQQCHCEEVKPTKQSKDVHGLDCFASLAMTVGKVKRVSMKDLWADTLDVNLDEYLTSDTMRQLCLDQGFSPGDDEPYEDLFYRVFLNKIEPKLVEMGAVIIYDYPAQMAALAKLSEDERYAERFELYINGIEIANAFSELCDPEEQRVRLEEERAHRQKLGKEVYDIDEEFISSLKNLNKAAGIALGIDRLVMVLLNCKNIDDVLMLPMSRQ
jgi:elongation factor P--(R)-beta-lysine ligase